MFLVLRCCCSEWWFCPYSTLQVPVIKTWKQIEVRYTFLFLIFGVSRISRFEMILCIIGFRRLQDFLFCINEKVFLLGHQVFVFLRDNCELPLQMMKLLVLDSWRLSTKISEFVVESMANTKVLHKNCLLMGTRLIRPSLSRQNQPISTFFDGSHWFGTQLLLLGVMIYVHLRLLMFVPPRSENKLQPIAVSFPKICPIAEFQFELILWIVGFQLLEDFFVLNQWKGLLSWISNFRVSLTWVP